MKKIFGLLLLILFMVICLFIYKKYDKDNENKLIDNIKSHYNDFVLTTAEANLYDNSENIIGKIGNKVNLQLESININKDTKYFKIANIDGYIDYSLVEPSKEIAISNHYKNYVAFNENIVTKDITSFYNDNGLVYSFNKSFNLPIIIKDTDKYYIEYDNQLLYVKKEDVEKIISSNNTDEKTKTNVRTLAYHFVYKEGDLCTNDYICHSEEQFVSHMKYLSDNNYFTLTMKDLELFLDGKIRIPEKSVVITLDDGHLAENAIKILDEYKINATYFLVTSWVNPKDLKSEYVYLASHTDNMHNNNKCPGGNQGGQILCEDKDVIIKDLNTSREKLNNTEVFCYPFYDYNDYAINILKEVGFKMAFIGAYNTEGMSNSSTDKFKIPRLTLSAYTTMDEFIEFVE